MYNNTFIVVFKSALYECLRHCTEISHYLSILKVTSSPWVLEPALPHGYSQVNTNNVLLSLF